MGRPVYVRVFANRFVLKRLAGAEETPVTVLSPAAFTTARLLVGEFAIAERVLRQALRNLEKRPWLRSSPVVLLHPMEQVQGGLCEVEERIFRELAIGAGARKVVLWIGPELSDAEALARLDPA